MGKEDEGVDDDDKSKSKSDDAADEGDEGKDRDEGKIPRSRLVAALKDQETRLTDRFTGQMTALRQELEAKSKVVEKPADKTRDVTRAELLVLVDEGKMTLAQADSIWEKKIIERASEGAKEAATREVTLRETKRRIDEDFRRYKESIPAAWREGTDERAQVAEEYRNLVAFGMPEALETELVALRSVFGPIEKFEKGKSKSRPQLDAEEQTGASDGGGGKGKGGNSTLIRSLSAREREHYDAQIKAKRYKDWAEVEAELKFANTETRRKNGAKV